MKSARIEKAVKVIDYAIKNKISVTEASVKCGYGYTYVKNVKAVVHDLHNNNAISDELFNWFNDAYEKYEHKDSKLVTKTKISPENKKPKDFPKLQEGEHLTFDVDEEKEEATADWTWNQNYPPDHITSLDELLEKCKVDLNIWKVDSYVVNKWDTTSWKSGEPITVQNYQVKARLLRNREHIKEVSVGQLFQEMTRTYKPPVYHVFPKTTTANKENNLLEISIFDLHIGKLAWGGETGENYDVKIARERFLGAIENLLHRASGFQYSRILFPVGNDFFNSDTILNTTTKGTPQDEDLRWQKTFTVGVKLLIDAINLLKQTGVPVDVVNIPGNHDFERSFYMGSVLEAWFNDDSQVSVNNGASPRKYYKFGKVLLGLTHGSEEKEGSLPMLMAVDLESKSMWSETIFHEWHVGHIHRKRDVRYQVTLDKTRMTNEDLGVTVRYLSSLTGTEEWHHKKGFVGAIKAADGFVWNYETGLIAQLNSNLVL